MDSSRCPGDSKADKSSLCFGDFADPLCRKRYHELQYTLKDQQDPRTGQRTNYDLFYHVIVVTEDRCRMWGRMEPERLAEALPGDVLSASDHQLVLYELSLMPDHMHLLVRGSARVSARELLDNIKDSSGRVLRRTALWQNGGYVGTVGPYRLQAVMKWNEAL
jgi:REP element-mobilizing transposase RayT